MLNEQEKQREFNKEIKIREKQSDVEYAKEIKREYEKWLENQKNKKIEKLNKNQNEFILVKAQYVIFIILLPMIVHRFYIIRADENIKLRQKHKNDQLINEIKEIKIALDELKEDEKREFEKVEKIVFL